jgi:hypothetical protein
MTTKFLTTRYRNDCDMFDAIVFSIDDATGAFTVDDIECAHSERDAIDAIVCDLSIDVVVYVLCHDTFDNAQIVNNRACVPVTHDDDVLKLMIDARKHNDECERVERAYREIAMRRDAREKREIEQHVARINDASKIATAIMCVCTSQNQRDRILSIMRDM